MMLHQHAPPLLNDAAPRTSAFADGGTEAEQSQILNVLDPTHLLAVLTIEQQPNHNNKQPMRFQSHTHAACVCVCVYIYNN